jgi:hypothetical protein
VATLAAVTAVIDDRLGVMLTTARAATGDSSKPSVAACVAWAVRLLGLPTAALATATDGEVGAVPTAQLDALLDLAELRTLERILTNLNQVDLTTGPVSERLGQLPQRLAELIPEKRKIIAAQWGKYLAEPLDPTTDKRKTRMKTL